jgi:hypothetical protein
MTVPKPGRSTVASFPAPMKLLHKSTTTKAASNKIYVDQIPKEKIQKNDSKEDEGIWLYLVPKFRLDDFNDEIV